MSKKARTNKMIRRKLLRVWNEANMQEELDEDFENLVLFGSSRIVKPEETDNLVRKGNEMKKLHYNVFDKLINI